MNVEEIQSLREVLESNRIHMTPGKAKTLLNDDTFVKTYADVLQDLTDGMVAAESAKEREYFHSMIRALHLVIYKLEFYTRPTTEEYDDY